MAAKEREQQAESVLPLYRNREHIGCCLQRKMALMRYEKVSCARSLGAPWGS